MEILKKISDLLFSTRAAGMYMLIFAIVIAKATFIENDWGTSSAQDIIFRTKWFELLLILFGLSIVANIIRYRMVQQKKWAALTFHLSIIIIILGAGVTRYFGYEGMMHIREGATEHTFLSSDTYLHIKNLMGDKSYTIQEKVYFSTLGSNKFDEKYVIGNKNIVVKLLEFLPNPAKQLVDQPDGKPTLKVVMAGERGREEYYLQQGNSLTINGVDFAFDSANGLGADVQFSAKNDSLTVNINKDFTQMVMATQKLDSLKGGQWYPLRLRSMYNLGEAGFVIGDYKQRGAMKIIAADQKVKNESLIGARLAVTVNGVTKEGVVLGKKGLEGDGKIVTNNGDELKYLDFGDLKMELAYGSRSESLPFSVKCRDFIMERYPGTNNPSSYASEVTVLDDKNNKNFDQRIFMNNILNYGGYRFFQSNYDPDEKGTYLSVNHDFWGTWISYIGYILLTLGMLLTFFSPNTRFTNLIKRLREYQAIVLLLLLSLVALPLSAGIVSKEIPVAQAKIFGNFIVQDHNGRFKPMNTLTSELLRKVSKKESLYGLNSDQIVASMLLAPEEWEQVALIATGGHPQIQALLGTTEKMVPYVKFFGPQGEYIISDAVRQAQNMNPRDQGTFEKAIIKLDERVNIANMVFSGHLMRLFPIIGDANHTWASISELMQQESKVKIDTTINQFFHYFTALNDGIASKNFAVADQEAAKFTALQRLNGGSVLPSETQFDAEMLLNKLDVFARLRNYYGLLAITILGVFFYTIFRPNANRNKLGKYALWAMLFGFVFHTIGLGLRWYVSGRAPWSNGYESMIYIGWTTVLAGLLFSKRSLGGLAATATLAATILLVAGMSWLDPEITPLVPVLKSYWLTIHVSLEAGSYGFLMLGAVIGMLNLLLMITMNANNKENTKRAIKELTIISEITLIGGLVMVSIGTYLGGVWANESWGRYWGWDAKETWALVTILVYAFILHMRFIPGLQSVYAFNFASLFGFATVIMTYFGVNYYLSGMHSYAAGDPVPIPPVVYYTTAALVVLSIVAYFSYRKKYADKAEA